MWFNIIKREAPQWKAFFENDIKEHLDKITIRVFGMIDGRQSDTIEDTIKRRKAFNNKMGYLNREFPTYDENVYYDLPRKYNIPMSAAAFIFESYKGPNPIKDVESYNKAIKKDLEDKQKAKQKERLNRRPPRKKGQDPRKKQKGQKKTRSQRQASAQYVRDKEDRKYRAARDTEQRRLRDERRGL